MAPGPDGDGDDEELVDIELEEIAGEALAPPRAPPLPARPISAPPTFARPPRPTEPQVPLEAPASPPPAEGEVELGDIVEVRQPIVEAAETDARADRVELESEAAAATEPARRAALLLEVARLVEAEGDGERALAAARRSVRGRSVAAGHAVGPATAAVAGRPLAGAGGRVSGGRGRRHAHAPARRAARARARIFSSSGGGCSRTGWGATTTPSPATTPRTRPIPNTRARCSPCCWWARGGRNRRRSRARSVAWRGGRKARAGPRWRSRRRASGGSPRRCPTARRARWACSTAELERGDAALPVATVLGELEALTAADAPPDVAVRALAEIAGRVAPIDRELAVALWRERARVQTARLDAPADALASLEEAARLDPAHPVVATDRLLLVEALAGGAAADALAPTLIADAATDDDAVDLALLHAETAIRAGRDAAAAASLSIQRVRDRRGGRADLRALELVLAIRARDAAALHDGFVAEAEHAGGKGTGEAASAADALVAAGAIKQWRLNDPPAAEALYRRALDRVPTHAPATYALVDRLLSDGRARRGGGVAREDADVGVGRLDDVRGVGPRDGRLDLRGRDRGARQGRRAPAPPGRADAQGCPAARASGRRRDEPRRRARRSVPAGRQPDGARRPRR